MSMRPVVDLSLGIQPQAMSVLYALEAYSLSVDFLFMPRTSAWYNGREQGICLNLRREKNKKSECLNIVFGECRNSDQIFVDVWVSDLMSLNPPTPDDFTDEAYANRKYFDCLDVQRAAKYIVDKVNDFATTER